MPGNRVANRAFAWISWEAEEKALSNAKARAARFRFQFRPVVANPGTRRRRGHDFFAREAGGFVWIADGRYASIFEHLQP